MRDLTETIPGGPTAKFTYFKPDSKKEGGAYITAIGAVKKVNSLERFVLLDDGSVISIDDILKIEDLFGG